jgi:hypothetical protein
VPVTHAWTVEIVPKMEHHSLANARMDILVNAAKYQVSIIFKNVLDVFFSLPFIFRNEFCWIEFYVFVKLSFRASVVQSSEQAPFASDRFRAGIEK